MKLRSGFVSNSSSSSFLIPLYAISGKQLAMIQDHSKIAQSMGMTYAASDYWSIGVRTVNGEQCVTGTTTMDNFDMREFLQRIGVPEAAIQWGDPYFDEDWR